MGGGVLVEWALFGGAGQRVCDSPLQVAGTHGLGFVFYPDHGSGLPPLRYAGIPPQDSPSRISYFPLEPNT